MSWLKHLAQEVERVGSKIEEGVVRTEAEIEGIVLPNARHDSEEERENDAIGIEIRKSHRFWSFAAERAQNFVKWHIDGHDYMYALSELLESAKECIFIMDWWLSPELYLRRPPASNSEWRLDRVLKRKADLGVKVYVIVYKEVYQTMSMNSSHTKHTLEALSPNILCMRHPDHIGARDTTEFWSHHEKVVVVDNHRACIGGLDLCFGRWDTHTHPLADVHPTEFSRTLFPGQDYNNARLMDFQKVDRYVDNTLSILSSPRMPWHDVHMTIAGDAVLDIVQHFVERWNEVKKRKYIGPQDKHYEWLAFPHYIPSIPSNESNEEIQRHSHREKLHKIGHHFKQRFLKYFDIDDELDKERYPPMPTGTCRVQVVRSVSDWSHGVLKEDSIQNAYIQLIMEANHYIYIENQFFITNTGDHGPVKNKIGKALVDRIKSAAKAKSKFQVVVVLPEVPGFSGDIHDDSSIKTIMAAQYRSMNRGGHSIYELLREDNIEPEDYIQFYHLRAYDRINAPYPSFIQKMEEKSGVKLFEAQVALKHLWLSPSAEGQHTSTKVAVKDSEPTMERITLSERTETKTETFDLPEEGIEGAYKTIKRFEGGAKDIRGDDDVSDNVVQHMLNDKTSLWDEKWLGTEDEERDAYVSELLYIHSKVMIVDDRRVIMGSANINDRSQKGDGDSEIALVVEDDDLIESRMDGKPYMASRFAASLRRQLYKEHLGLIPPQICVGPNEVVTDEMRPAAIRIENKGSDEFDEVVWDPLSDDTIKLWRDRAEKNTKIFSEIFKPVPSNQVRNWEEYKNHVPKVKSGHVVPGVSLHKIKESLSQVKGALVECPMNFLIDEKEFVDNIDWSGFNPTLPIYI